MPRLTRRRSSISNERPATPTSRDIADSFMNFRFNHRTQRNTLPDVLGRGSDSGVSWGPCNQGGVPNTSRNAKTGDNFNGTDFDDAGTVDVNKG